MSPRAVLEFVNDAVGGYVHKLFGGKRTDKHKLPTAFEQLSAEFEEDVIRRKSHIAMNPKFNAFIAGLILVDTVVIYVEVDYTYGNNISDRLIFFILDFLFALIFFAEMLIRQNQLGWDYFTDPWNVFDYSVVVLNCADIIVALTSEGSNNVKLAATFRVLRLLRIVRTIKGLKIFFGLWMIMQGLLDSIRTLLWVAIMMFIIIYCAAVALTTLVPDDDFVNDRWPEANLYVGSVWRSMWTTCEIITLDRWVSNIARPLLEVSPLAVVLVFGVIFICTFGMLNIIISVMVERLRTMAQESKDMSNKVLEKTEQELFLSMAQDFGDADLDEDGELGFIEFQEMIKTPSMVFKLRLLGIMISEAEALFEIMDADKSGSVSPEEFVTGLQKLKGVARGQDLVQLICFAQKQCLRATKFVDRLRELNAKADIIQDRLNSMGSGISDELRSRVKAAERNQDVWKKAAERHNVISKLDKTRQVNFPSLAGTQPPSPS